MPGVGTAMPPGPDHIQRRVENLEKLVQRMAANNVLNASTIDAGDLQIINNGSVKVIDTDGHVVAQIGALPEAFNRSDGTRQPGMVFYREDGTIAAFLGDLNPLVPPFQQSWQATDRAGRVVLADDTNSGTGLAAPHINVGGGMQDTNTATWPATTAGTWTDICDCFIEVQNPNLFWSITLQADAGTTGQFRLMVNGTQVGTTQTVTAGFASWSPPRVAMPAGVNVGDIVGVEIDAQRTAGTGTVRAHCTYLSGWQS